MTGGPVTAGREAGAGQSAFDVQAVRAQFPILSRTINGKPLVYLDSGATTQRPRCVLDAVRDFYEQHNANVHRGVHTLSQEATELFEGARATMARLMGAGHEHEIVFTRGTTEAINIAAQVYAQPRLKAGDEVLITHMEHHSNIVPWQMVCERTGAVLKVVPVTDQGELDLDAMAGEGGVLSERTKVVSLVHVSNTLGTINPVQRVVELVRERCGGVEAGGPVVVVDGAQALPHVKVDVRAIGCDFYAMSGHKMYGPTGIGALWGRRELLEQMGPWMGGGDMIKHVTFEKTQYNDVPWRFEAGTGNIAGAIGMAAAGEFVMGLGYEAIAAHERELLAHGQRVLGEIDGLKMIGTARDKSAVFSFVFGDAHSNDIGTLLDMEGIAVRTGHHCTQPLMDRFGISGTTRASMGVYNTTDDLDRLAQGLVKVLGMLW